VESDAVGWDALERVVDRLYVLLDNFAVLGESCVFEFRAVPAHCQTRIV
jgi:hypothetical protein